MQDLAHSNPRRRLRAALYFVRNPDPQAIPLLLSRITDHDPKVLFAVHKALKIIGGEELISLLFAMLRSNNLIVQKAALAALRGQSAVCHYALADLAEQNDDWLTTAALDLISRKAQHPATVRVVTRALKSSNPKIIIAAINCIERWTEVNLAKRLLSFLNRPDEIGQAAMAAVAAAAYVPALPALARVIDRSTSAQLTHHAASALKRILEEAHPWHLKTYLASSQGALLICLAALFAEKKDLSKTLRGKLSKAAGKALATPQQNKSWLTLVLQVVAMVGAKPFTKQLLALASYSGLEQLQPQIVGILHQDGDQAILGKAVRHLDPRQALCALGALNLDAGTPSLSQIIWHHPHPAVRAAMALRLGQSGQTWALPILGRLVSDEDAAIREKASIALGKLGLPECAGYLAAGLNDPDPAVAWSAGAALEANGHPSSMEVLCQGLKNERSLVREICVCHLGERLLPFLELTAGDTDSNVRLALLQQLLVLNKPAWFMRLKKQMLGDSHEKVKVVALKLCAKWDYKERTAILTKAAMSNKIGVFIQAIELLGELSGQQSQEVLGLLLQSYRTDKKVAALQALAHSGLRYGQPAILPCLYHNSAAVRERAYAALSALRDRLTDF